MTQNTDLPQEGAQTTDQLKNIIASLCVGAPSDVIRNCIRKYDPAKSTSQIEKDMKKDKKEILVDTLQYLGVTGMNQYRHDALPHELVCRIQNLLPDNCNLCNQSYCVKLGERPILSCVRCGQGCHTSCVLQITGKSNDDFTESNNYGLSVINPFATLGLFYLCGYCQGEVIPNKDNLKVRQGQGSRRTSLSLSNNVDNTNDTNHSETQLQNGSTTRV